MNGPWRGIRAWAVAGAVLLGAISPGCRPAPAAPELPRVAATIFPLFDIVREIGGPDVQVSVILPPGANPHTFEPTPGSVKELAKAATIFRIGHGIDDWSAAMAQSAGVATLVTVDDRIALRHFAPSESDLDHPTPGNIDPHYFMTIRNARQIAITVESALLRIVPLAARRLAERRSAYLRGLDRAELEIRGLLSSLSNREIATFHNAFGYFADEYGLKIVTVFEPFPGQEPGPQDIAAFQRRVRENHLPVIFAEPQMSTDGIAPIARDLGVKLSMLDDMGGVRGRETYIELMLFDARQIAAACGKRKL